MSTGKRIIEQYESFISHLEKSGFTLIEPGSFRQTYVRGRVVIKVPLNTDGANDNIFEAKAWRKYRNAQTNLGLFLAPCRLLSNGALMMVKVDTELSEDDYENHNWVKDIDGAQAGYYKNKIVAYDYALNLKERAGWEKELQTQSEYFFNYWVRSRSYLLEE